MLNLIETGNLALEDFESHNMPEEWVQWLQYARDDPPSLEA